MSLRGGNVFRRSNPCVFWPPTFCKNPFNLLILLKNLLNLRTVKNIFRACKGENHHRFLATLDARQVDRAGCCASSRWRSKNRLTFTMMTKVTRHAPNCHCCKGYVIRLRFFANFSGVCPPMVWWGLVIDEEVYKLLFKVFDGFKVCTLDKVCI